MKIIFTVQDYPEILVHIHVAANQIILYMYNNYLIIAE